MVFEITRKQEPFFKRNGRFADHLPVLHKAAEKILLHSFEPESRGDGIIFLLDRLIVEEFMEIFLLCTYDYGFGAQRLLRGMYERLVASLLIEQDPVQGDRFLEYNEIQHLKFANHRRDLNKRHILTPEGRSALEARCKELEVNFLVEKCDVCKTTRKGHSWSPLDMVTMARMVKLEALYVDYFFVPTMQLHNTSAALNTRVRFDGDKTISFIEGPQPDLTDEVMKHAHHLLFLTLDHHNNHFKLKQEELIKSLGESLKTCWTEDPPPPGAAPPGSG